ncbi:MAG: malto-oligosyltrehalose synthase [Sphingobium sp.]|nr:malto-oligosyltrehalose synthase [Sphingobium sp.]
MIPRATYRLQLTRDFPFDAACAIVPYLARLGVSHIYASPITMARAGSTHGYDVVDPTRINPELGGEEGFRALVHTLRAHGMGIIIDIVPNHMGVAGGENGWWNDVLRNGPESRYARYFDIDWRTPLVLPILGDSLTAVIAQGDLGLSTDGPEPCLLLYGEQRLPLRPGSLDAFAAGEALDARQLRALADAQHYRLVSWRTANDSLNWRRFFSINELAGLRIEDPAVFDATHRLYFDLFREGLIDGVRVDHIDGLTDPAGYGRALRAAFDAIRTGKDRAYIVAEKILATEETMADDWGMDGTSGYDVMRDLTALLHDPRGEEPLRALWRSLDPGQCDFGEEVLAARRDMLSWQFEAQLAACVSAFAALAGSAAASEPAFEAITLAMLRRAIERLLWVFPVYRTYGNGVHAPASDAAVRDQAWAAVQPHLPPGEAPVARHILDWLGGLGPGDPELAAEAVRRFQQLSAPVAAKGVEDTAFYRYAPLLSANDVGFAPEQFAISPAEFHQRVLDRQRRFPHAMLATATHDHKRGEDVRARLAVLSAVPALWAERQRAWTTIAERHGPPVHPADRYQLFQTLFGAWPSARSPAKDTDFASRMAAWLEKSLREARLRSSWEAPDADYEARAAALLHALLGDAAFTADMDDFVAKLAPAAQANTLVQTALKYCMPGVPDLYQGCELHDFSLVDPDNRRLVDFARRAAMLDRAAESPEGEKLALIARLLGYRKACPDLFAHGQYQPLAVAGPRAGQVLAFERTHGDARLVCAVLLRAAEAMIEGGGPPDADWWAGTAIEGDRALPAHWLFADAPIFFRADF